MADKPTDNTDDLKKLPDGNLDGKDTGVETTKGEDIVDHTRDEVGVLLPLLSNTTNITKYLKKISRQLGSGKKFSDNEESELRKNIKLIQGHYQGNSKINSYIGKIDERLSKSKDEPKVDPAPTPVPPVAPKPAPAPTPKTDDPAKIEAQKKIAEREREVQSVAKQLNDLTERKRFFDAYKLATNKAKENPEYFALLASVATRNLGNFDEAEEFLKQAPVRTEKQKANVAKVHESIKAEREACTKWHKEMASDDLKTAFLAGQEAFEKYPNNFKKDYSALRIKAFKEADEGNDEIRQILNQEVADGKAERIAFPQKSEVFGSACNLPLGNMQAVRGLIDSYLFLAPKEKELELADIEALQTFSAAIKHYYSRSGKKLSSYLDSIISRRLRDLPKKTDKGDKGDTPDDLAKKLSEEKRKRAKEISSLAKSGKLEEAYKMAVEAMEKYSGGFVYIAIKVADQAEKFDKAIEFFKQISGPKASASIQAEISKLQLKNETLKDYREAIDEDLSRGRIESTLELAKEAAKEFPISFGPLYKELEDANSLQKAIDKNIADEDLETAFSVAKKAYKKYPKFFEKTYNQLKEQLESMTPEDKMSIIHHLAAGKEYQKAYKLARREAERNPGYFMLTAVDMASEAEKFNEALELLERVTNPNEKKQVPEARADIEKRIKHIDSYRESITTNYENGFLDDALYVAEAAEAEFPITFKGVADQVKHGRFKLPDKPKEDAPEKLVAPDTMPTELVKIIEKSFPAMDHGDLFALWGVYEGKMEFDNPKITERVHEIMDHAKTYSEHTDTHNMVVERLQTAMKTANKAKPHPISEEKLDTANISKLQNWLSRLLGSEAELSARFTDIFNILKIDAEKFSDNSEYIKEVQLELKEILAKEIPKKLGLKACDTYEELFNQIKGLGIINGKKKMKELSGILLTDEITELIAEIADIIEGGAVEFKEDIFDDDTKTGTSAESTETKDATESASSTEEKDDDFSEEEIDFDEIGSTLIDTGFVPEALKRSINEFIEKLGFNPNEKRPAIIAIRNLLTRHGETIDLDELIDFLKHSELAGEVDKLIKEKSEAELQKLISEEKTRIEDVRTEIQDERKIYDAAAKGSDDKKKSLERLHKLVDERNSAKQSLKNYELALDKKKKGGVRETVHYDNPEHVLGMINLYIETESAKERGETPDHTKILEKTHRQIAEARRSQAGIGHRILSEVFLGVLKPRLTTTLKAIAEKDPALKKIASDQMVDLAKQWNDQGGVNAWINSLGASAMQVAPAIIGHLDVAINAGGISGLNTISLNRAKGLVEKMRYAMHKQSIESAKKSPGNKVQQMSHYFNSLNSINGKSSDVSRKIVRNNMLKVTARNALITTGMSLGGATLASLSAVGLASSGLTMASGAAGYSSFRVENEKTKKLLRRSFVRGLASAGVMGGATVLGLAAGPAALLAVPAVFSPEIGRRLLNKWRKTKITS